MNKGTLRTIAICIATYRRPVMLARLLDALRSCTTPANCLVELRIIDNDTAHSARTTCEHAALATHRPIITRLQPLRSIAAARNTAIDLGPADLFIFIDDDEVPPKDWILNLVNALDTSGADAAVGSVLGRCPAGTPPWISRGQFFDKPTAPAGTPMHWRGGRTSNTIIRGSWFHGPHHLRFDQNFGLSGAEDTQIFLQMARHNARLIGAPLAAVTEDVEPDRTNFRWLWNRHVRGGRNYHRLCALDTTPTRSELTLAAARCLRCLTLLLCAAPSLLIGRFEHAARALFQLALAWGGLSAWLMPERAAASCAYPERPTHLTTQLP